MKNLNSNQRDPVWSKTIDPFNPNRKGLHQVKCWRSNREVTWWKTPSTQTVWAPDSGPDPGITMHYWSGIRGLKPFGRSTEQTVLESLIYRPKFTKTVWVILTVTHPKAYDSSILRLRLTTWYFTTREIYLVLVLSRSNLFFISAFWANFRLRIRANFGWSFSHFRWINFLEST